MVLSMTIDFLEPARMDDELEVVTLPQEVKGASAILRQQVGSADETLEHDLFPKTGPTPHQMRGRLFPYHAPSGVSCSPTSIWLADNDGRRPGHDRGPGTD